MTAFTLDDRYLTQDGEVYLTGVQALVRVVLDRLRDDRRAGLATAAFISGYEGSPLGGLDMELARRRSLMEPFQVVHQPGLNEELAATSVMGSQLAARLGLKGDGVTGYWYGKAPGLDRATDALRHANMAGTHPRGGAVALVGDDPNAKSSTVPSASEAALADLSIPVLFPADSAEVVEFGRHAVELSRASGLWSALKVVANVADAAGNVTVSRDWAAPVLAAPGAYRHEPSARLLGADLKRLEQSLYDVRLPLAMEYIRASGINRLLAGPADRVGIVAAGKSYLDVRQALRMLGLGLDDLPRLGIRLLKLGAVWPVEPDVVQRFGAGLAEVIIVEEKRAFLEPAVKDVLYGLPGAPAVHGKSLFTQAGELDPDMIARALRTRLAHYEPIAATLAAEPEVPRQRVSLPLLARTPYFCSGCPHNTSTRVPEGSTVGAGIGCHTLALLMPSEAVGDIVGLTQMGGEGAQWIGMAPFVATPHLIQNLGDGTYAHSGTLAIRAAIAAGVNITYKILFNSAVAMTGGQQAVGGQPLHILAERLQREGAAKVVITSDAPSRVTRVPGVAVRHRDELIAVQEELSRIPGVTVLIHEQECAAEKRRKRRRGKATPPAQRVLINERVCEGCGDCGATSNCLSVQPVETEFGRKTAIHQSSCNLDFSCLKGDCPSFLTVTPAALRPARPGRPARPVPDLAADVLPAPDSPAGTSSPAGDGFTVRITGIGGTGVVTVSQVLATAAFLDGRQVRALDQIGLAQKGGAVVSDVKVTAVPVEQSAKLAAGECDLYLACDPLVGADPVNLHVANAGSTVAVVSTAEVPTGAMITDPGVSFPGRAQISSAIEAAVARTWYVDAHGLAERLFGDDQFANILQLGAGYQTGAIGLSAQAIERAIEANGTAAAKNIQAFRRGRQAIADPAGLERDLRGSATGSAAGAAVGFGPTGGFGAAGEFGPTGGFGAATGSGPAVDQAAGPQLDQVLAVRVPDLAAYQDAAYAAEYASFVEKVRAAAPDLAVPVARNLYKLMAYKDEYEVARLSLDPALDAAVEEQFGPGARVAYQLHPPVLRALGMNRKVSLGPWFRPAFRALRAARGVRGSRLDPFGRSEVRRTERALIAEYRAAIEQVLRAGADHPLAVELAELPDMVRGYEEIKLANVARYRARQAEILAALTEPASVTA
jgi:indolepyruvate ferredoxin oxidoreductase